MGQRKAKWNHSHDWKIPKLRRCLGNANVLYWIWAIMFEGIHAYLTAVVMLWCVHEKSKHIGRVVSVGRRSREIQSIMTGRLSMIMWISCHVSPFLTLSERTLQWVPLTSWHEDTEHAMSSIVEIYCQLLSCCHCTIGVCQTLKLVSFWMFQHHCEQEKNPAHT